MQKLLPLITGQQSPGVYRLRSAARAKYILASVQPYGWQSAHLVGEQIATKAALLHACATAFHFPNYFGHNWDALEDSLRDLAWLPAKGYLLLYDNVSTLAKPQPQEWAIALAIFQEVSAHWQQMHIPFVLLLRNAGRFASSVEKL